MFNTGSIWNTYDDNDNVDYYEDDFGSYAGNAKIVSYWTDIKNKVNIKDPIYKWPCFNTISAMNGYINEIASCLRAFRYSNADIDDWKAKNDEQKAPQSEGRIAFSCLFLVRCALICRCRTENDWDLKIQDAFFEGIGQRNFSRSSDWSSCIKNAERELCRPSLLRFDDDFVNENNTQKNAKRYCARVLVEAGIPLYSLQGSNEVHTRIEVGLKNVWKLYSSTINENAYEQTIKKFMATGNLKDPMGQSFWLPGGLAGCRSFFSIGLDLLETIGEKIKKGEDVKQALKEEGFENPTDASINYIFGIRNNHIPKRPIEIKRILHWEDDECYTHVYIDFKPESRLWGVKEIELKIEEKTYDWCYADNGIINGDDSRQRCYEHEFASAVLTKKRCNAEPESYEILNAVDFSQPIFFRQNVDKEYEQISEKSLRETAFPICVIFPNGYIEANMLNLNGVEISNLSVENDTITYQVYRFNSEEQFNKSGLSLASSKLIINPPEQSFIVEYFDADGKKCRNFDISTDVPRAPLRCINSEILFSKNRINWKRELERSSNEGNFIFGYYKLDTASRNDSGCAVLTLPREFRYITEDYEKNGIHFEYKNEDGLKERITNVETEIDGKRATKEDWRNVKYDSIIRCTIKNERNEKIILTIPSPAIGISWFNLPNNSKTSVVELAKDPVKLNCVQNENNHFDIVYNIKLVDKDRVLLDFDYRVSPCYDGKKEYTIDLPAYLSKLFSATNSLDAVIKISAQAERNEKVIAQTNWIEITRFDESDYDGDFFCVGIINQEVLKPNVMPTEEEKSRELWMKVPSWKDINGCVKWNSFNRIRLINAVVSDTSNLNSFQKILVGNDFDLARRRLTNYFNSHCRNLDEEVIKQIERSFDLCVEYNIPICNLWVLQATIQDDRIFVQIPNIYKFKHLLNSNTYLCSFDWRLIRPSSLNFVKNDEIRRIVKRQIDEEKEESNEVKEGFVEYKTINKLPDPPFYDDEEIPSSWRLDDFKDELIKGCFEPYFYSNELCRLLCFIVKYVVYGKDEVYQKWLSWATLCLKFLECVDSSATQLYSNIIREKTKNTYKINQHRDGFQNIVWDEWKTGCFKDTIGNVEHVNQISDEDPYKQGQNDAINKFLERYWIESLKKITSNSESEVFYFDLYRCPFPKISGREELDQKIADVEKKYKQYRAYYELGWNKVDCQEPVRCCCYLRYLECKDLYKDIPEKALIVGKIVHLWFKKWHEKVDEFKAGKKLKENLKRMVPLMLLDLNKNEAELSGTLVDLGERVPKKIGEIFDEINIENYPNDKNLRSVGNKCKNKDCAEKLLRMVGEGFGNYRAFYDMMEYYYKRNNFLEGKKYKEKSMDFLDPRAWLYDAKNKENVEQFIKAASLGSSEAHVRIANIYEGRALDQFKRFIEKYERLHNKVGLFTIDFAGDIKDSFISCIKYLKDMFHYYKTAARLGNAIGCFGYYNAIIKYRYDVNDLFSKVYTTNLNSSERSEIRRNRAIFDKWFGLNNEWVYLRKFAVKNNNTEQSWNEIRDSYERTIIDKRDGKKYDAIYIADKWWLAENLKFELPDAKKVEGDVYYSNDLAKKAVIEGWRLPSKADFEELEKWCSKHSIRKDPAGVSLKSMEWLPDEAIKGISQGTDDFGFAAKPVGLMIEGFDKVLRKDETFYWTDSEINNKEAHCVCLSSSDNEMGYTSMSKDYCLSVRLVCDDLPYDDD